MSLGPQWATGALGPPPGALGPPGPWSPRKPTGLQRALGEPRGLRGPGPSGGALGFSGDSEERLQGSGPQGPPGSAGGAPSSPRGAPGARRRAHRAPGGQAPPEGFQGSCGQRAPLAVRRPPGAQRAPIELVRESKGPCSPKRGLLGGFQDPWVPRAPSTQGSRCPRRAPRVPGAREEP